MARLLARLAAVLMIVGFVVGFVWPGMVTGALLPIGITLWWLAGSLARREAHK